MLVGLIVLDSNALRGVLEVRALLLKCIGGVREVRFFSPRSNQSSYSGVREICGPIRARIRVFVRSARRSNQSPAAGRLCEKAYKLGLTSVLSPCNININGNISDGPAGSGWVSRSFLNKIHENKCFLFTV